MRPAKAGPPTPSATIEWRWSLDHATSFAQSKTAVSFYTPCIQKARGSCDQVLGALASVLSIWLVTGILVYEAIDRVMHPVHVNGKGKQLSMHACCCCISAMSTTAADACCSK
jgi:Co/Zn/Cd efflux system component